MFALQDSNITDLLQGEHPEILAGMHREGYRKKRLLTYKSSNSLKCGKLRPTLLLRSNRKSYTRFWLVRKSATLDDLLVRLRSLTPYVPQNCQSVSMTLKYRGQVSLNTSKIIPRLISLVFLVCRDHNIWIYSKGNTTKFWLRQGYGRYYVLHT